MYKLLRCERTGSDNACVRVASKYHFAKLMEIAESVPTGRVRATSDKSDKRQFCRLSLALSLPVRSHPKS